MCRNKRTIVACTAWKATDHWLTLLYKTLLKKNIYLTYYLKITRYWFFNLYIINYIMLLCFALNVKVQCIMVVCHYTSNIVGTTSSSEWRKLKKVPHGNVLLLFHYSKF